MLSKKDIAILQGMFVENNKVWDASLKKRLDQRFVAFEIRFDDFKHEIREEIHAVVTAAVTASERRVIDEITEFIGEGVLPQIDEHTRQISVINRHLKLA